MGSKQSQQDSSTYNDTKQEITEIKYTHHKINPITKIQHVHHNEINQISDEDKTPSIGTMISQIFAKRRKTDENNCSYTVNGVKTYYPDTSKKNKDICSRPGCDSTEIYYLGRHNSVCEKCIKTFPNVLPQDKHYCLSGCATNFRRIRHIVKCNDCVLEFCSNCINHHNYHSHCKCDSCKLKCLVRPMTGVMIYQSKCDFCKLVIPLDNKTAITWLKDRNFTYDTLYSGLNTMINAKFSILGHEGDDIDGKALCLECQSKFRTSDSFSGSIPAEYKNFGYIRNTRIPEFTYLNHDDKKIYRHPTTTLNMKNENLIECLNIYLTNLSFNNQGIIDLLSLPIRLDSITNNDIKLTIITILTSNDEKDLIKKKRLTTLFDTIWNDYVSSLTITGLNAPLIRMIYDYSPTSEYSEFFTEVAK